MFYAPLRERPVDFRLNPASPLYRGLVFAALGRSPGGTLYFDSSPFANHGTLTNFSGAGDTPAAMWGWDSMLRRTTLRFDASNDYVAVPTLKGFPTTQAYNPNIGLDDSNTGWTIALWNRITSYVAYSGVVQFGYCGLVQGRSTKWEVLRQNSFVGCNKTSASTIQNGAWTHLAAVAKWPAPNPVQDDPNTSIYVNGKLDNGTFGADNSFGANIYKIGAQYAASAQTMADVLVWYRTQPADVLARLADPSNVDLRVQGVPLVIPVRRWWPVGGSSAKPWIYKTARNQTIQHAFAG